MDGSPASIIRFHYFVGYFDPPSTRHGCVMSLKTVGVIEIPNAKGSAFDHAAFDPKTRRVFIAHTARDCIEVIDHDAGRHLATLPGFPGAAGAVVDAGQVVVTNRGSASVSWVDGETLKTTATFKTGARPNGAAIVGKSGWAIVACIGDDTDKPSLQLFTRVGGRQASVDLPGRPRWCVTDAAGECLFLCIRDPSLVLVVSLPDLRTLAQLKVPKGGAHGLDIDHARGRLYVACDDNALVEIDSRSGTVENVWPIAGPPDVTFFNPATGRVHVAIGEPGVVETIDPRSGERVLTPTGHDAHTTALVVPDRTLCDFTVAWRRSRAGRRAMRKFPSRPTPRRTGAHQCSQTSNWHLPLRLPRGQPLTRERRSVPRLESP